MLLSKKDQNYYISNLSKRELTIVAGRLSIDKTKLTFTIKNKLKLVTIKDDLDSIKIRFSQHTKDPNDAHVIVGAVKAKVQFLLTYNLKDYKIDKIKKAFGIIVITPAKFLQYLRSQ